MNFILSLILLLISYDRFYCSRRVSYPSLHALEWSKIAADDVINHIHHRYEMGNGLNLQFFLIAGNMPKYIYYSEAIV